MLRLPYCGNKVSSWMQLVNSVPWTFGVYFSQQLTPCVFCIPGGAWCFCPSGLSENRDSDRILGTLRWAGVPFFCMSCYHSHVIGILTNLPELLYPPYAVSLERSQQDTAQFSSEVAFDQRVSETFKVQKQLEDNPLLSGYRRLPVVLFLRDRCQFFGIAEEKTSHLELTQR